MRIPSLKSEKTTSSGATACGFRRRCGDTTTEAVEQITGRRVIGYHSQIVFRPAIRLRDLRARRSTGPGLARRSRHTPTSAVAAGTAACLILAQDPPDADRETFVPALRSRREPGYRLDSSTCFIGGHGFLLLGARGTQLGRLQPA